MRVQIVDPPAYTPPYDRALATALAAAGAEVELLTSPFAHGSVPPAEGYEAREVLYTRASRRPAGSPSRRVLRALEHLPAMRRVRAAAADADVVHVQWLTAPPLDARLLPRSRPRVLTGHGLLRGASGAALMRGAVSGFDAFVALSDYGAGVLRERHEISPERVHVIPHGPLDYLTRLPEERPLPPELAGAEGPVVLFFGLLRPYKGIDVLLEAFRAVEGAELWIVGRPFGVDRGEIEVAARRCASRVRILPRFVDDPEVPAIFRRADLVVLPHREAEQSGVLFTALAFAKPIVMSDVGGFGEVAGIGAGRLVPPGEPEALAGAITDLLGDAAERERLAAAAAAAAAGPYSWGTIATRHLDLYRSLGAG